MTERVTSSIYKWTMHHGKEAQPSPRALADRERRLRIPDTRDLTGQLLGDPPPGRSALDKKREAELRRVLGQTPVAELVDDEGEDERNEEHADD